MTRWARIRSLPHLLLYIELSLSILTFDWQAPSSRRFIHLEGKSRIMVQGPRIVQQSRSLAQATQQQPWSSSRVGAPPSRLSLSTSYAKLSIVATTLIAHYLLTPALAAPFGSDAAATVTSQDDIFTSRKHSPADEDAPRTPLKLAFDILSIAGLVILGGIFAGLTLGLMGLDMVNLQVLSTSGTPDEQQHAKKVLKLLEKGRHWVLVVLLLGNVIVNETLPIFLSDFGGGLAAVLSSTLLIVIFGEIVPQVRISDGKAKDGTQVLTSSSSAIRSRSVPVMDWQLVRFARH